MTCAASITYPDLLDATSDLNELEALALHYADRAWGWDNTDPEDWCPVAAQTTKLAASVAQEQAEACRAALDVMISMFNEHSELTVSLEWERYDGRWEII